ncbi:MAG: hypothetical protein LC104_12390 [Bacteroidales bacterium]|nr:hypothetical protein [Bacteroidales bacterium]
MILYPLWLGLAGWFTALCGYAGVPLVTIHAGVDRPIVRVGDPVALFEGVGQLSTRQYRTITHDVWWLAASVAQSGDDEKSHPCRRWHRISPVASHIADLGDGHVFYHGIFYDTVQNGCQGIVFPIRFLQAGIFVVWPCWVADTDTQVSGIPVIVWVLPKP